MLPKHGIAVGDRGFCSHKVLDQFIENDALFIIRIKSNWKWDENYHMVIANKFATFAFICKPCPRRGYSDDQGLKVLHFLVK